MRRRLLVLPTPRLLAQARSDAVRTAEFRSVRYHGWYHEPHSDKCCSRTNRFQSPGEPPPLSASEPLADQSLMHPYVANGFDLERGDMRLHCE
jgi:hypothetical protein